MLKKIALAATAVGFVFLVAEGAVRVSLFGASALSVKAMRSERGARLLRRASPPGPHFEYVPGLDLLFKGVRFRTNAFGMPDVERTAARTPGKRRIAVIGDSFSTPWGIAREDGWPALLEASLPASEVLNFSVVGYGPEEYLATLRTKALAFDPDVVVIGWCGENDHLRGGGLALWGIYTASEGRDGFWTSYLLEWAKSAPVDTRAVGDSYSPQERRFIAEQFALLRESAGRRRVIVYQLGLRERRGPELERLARSAGLEFLDARPALASRDWREWRLNSLDWHPGPQAQPVFARALADVLR